MQLYLAQTQQEAESCRERTGLSAAELLNAHGVFAVPTTAVGCVALTEEERTLLGKKKVSAVVTPLLNGKSGLPHADVTACVQAGMNVALGTAGAVDSGSLDMFEVMRSVACNARVAGGDSDKMPAAAVLMMATTCGARAQGRKDNCGMLKEGMDADLVMVDFSAPHLIPCHDVMNALVFSAKGGDVALTMVGGKILYQNGAFPTLDLSAAVQQIMSHTIGTIMGKDEQ